MSDVRNKKSEIRSQMSEVRNQKSDKKVVNALLCVGMLVLLASAFLPIVGVRWDWLRWAFAAGAVMTLVSQVLMPVASENFRVRRLWRMNVWSAILYCVSAACLFIHDESMQKSWVAFLLAGAVLQIYATLMISRLTNQDMSK